jgi:hypothetical protein
MVTIVSLMLRITTRKLHRYRSRVNKIKKPTSGLNAVTKTHQSKAVALMIPQLKLSQLLPMARIRPTILPVFHQKRTLNMSCLSTKRDPLEEIYFHHSFVESISLPMNQIFTFPPTNKILTFPSTNRPMTIFQKRYYVTSSNNNSDDSVVPLIVGLLTAGVGIGSVVYFGPLKTFLGLFLGIVFGIAIVGCTIFTFTMTYIIIIEPLIVFVKFLEKKLKR